MKIINNVEEVVSSVPVTTADVVTTGGEEVVAASTGVLAQAKALVVNNPIKTSAVAATVVVGGYGAYRGVRWWLGRRKQHDARVSDALREHMERVGAQLTKEAEIDMPETTGAEKQ